MIKYFFYLYYNRWYEDGKGDTYKPWIPVVFGVSAVLGIYTLVAIRLIFDLSQINKQLMKLYFALLILFYGFLVYQISFSGNKAIELYNSFGDSSKIKNYKTHQVISIVIYLAVFSLPFIVYTLIKGIH